MAKEITRVRNMTGTNTFGTRGYTIGARVEAHPGTDCWMMGDRYGDVVKVGRTLVHVKMDRSGKVRKFHPDNLMFVN